MDVSAVHMALYSDPARSAEHEQRPHCRRIIVITKDPSTVIHRVDAVEAYLDNYLARNHLTFEDWADRFGDDYYTERNDLIVAEAAVRSPRAVLEFACAGPFLAAQMLTTVPSIERYVCSNFSPRMLQYCRLKLQGMPRGEIALLDADVVRSPDLRPDRIAEYDLFVSTSLEHIEYDIELVRGFPLGAGFIFSLTRYDDDEHFRVFETPEDITTRYGSILRIDALRENREASKFIVRATRRDV